MLARRLRASKGRMRLVASTTSTSAGGTIVVPTGCAIGDLFILANVSGNSTAAIPTAVVPSGFTSISDVSGTGGTSGDGYRSILSCQRATSDISGTTLTCMNGTSSDTMLLAVYRGRTAFATATPLDATGEFVSSGDPSAQTININGQTPPIIVVATGKDVTFASANKEVVSGNFNMKLAAFDGPSDDITATGDGNAEVGILQSCYIQLTY